MKKTIKILSLALIIISILAIVASCSARNDNKATEDLDFKPNSPEAAQDSEFTDDYNGAGEYYREESASKSAESGASLESEKKIVKNAEVSMTVEDVEGTYQKLLQFAKQNKGYEANLKMDKSTSSVRITADIKIDPQNLDKFIEYINTFDKVNSCSISSDDVTAEYYDVKTRIETMEKSLLKYYEYLNAAKNTTEMLTIQKEINTLTSEIEVLKGRQRLLNSQIAESNVSLSISKKTETITIEEEIDWNALSIEDMWKLMKRGFLSVSTTIVTVLQWILILFVSASPILIPIIIIIIIIIIIMKKKKKKTKKM
jgi:hypothetical protein